MGVTVHQIRYRPYGSERWHSGNNPTEQDWDFTGQRLERGLGGLLDYGARYYDPLLGRFISPDSVVPDYANPQDLNRYAYVRGNPLRFTDPTGHYTFEEEPDDAYIWYSDKPQGYEQTLIRGADADTFMMRVETRGNVLPGDGTLTVGWADTFDIFVEGTVGIGIFMMDEKGNIAMGTTTWGFGGSNTLGATTGPYVTVTNAADMSELQGFYVNAGGGGAVGLGSVTIDYVGGRGKKGRIDGASISLAAGPKILFPTPPVGEIPATLPPVFVHSNFNYTPDQAVFTLKTDDAGNYSGCFSIFSQCSLSTFNEAQ